MKLPSFLRGVRDGSARPAIFGLAALSMLIVHAQAQTTITPYSHLQDGTITSTNSTIDVLRVPAYDSTGKTHYWDIQLVFDTASDGSMTLAADYPIITASDNPLTSHFKAGAYVSPAGSTIVVNGPAVTSGGDTEWSLAQTGGCNFPYSATWYVGTNSSNPLYARLKAAGITSTVFSYGLLGTATGCGSDWWDAGALLGFSQTGNSITIVSFSAPKSNGAPLTDYSTPGAQITYTLK